MSQEKTRLTFGKWINDIKDDTVVGLAEKTGLQRSNLSSMLKKDDISHKHLIKLCRALNYNLYFKAAIEVSKSMLMDKHLSYKQQNAAAEKLMEIEKAVDAFHVLLSGKEPHFVEETKTTYWQNKISGVPEEKGLETKWEKDFSSLSKLKQKNPDKP
jgi:hypothetical protein